MPIKKQVTESPSLQRDRAIFSRNFRKARRDAELTQKELARITGLSQAFLSAVENGKSTVSLDNALTLARAVGKPLHHLLTPNKK